MGKPMEDLEELFTEIEVWCNAARGLIKLPPSSRDPELQSQVVDALTRIISSIDFALELPEIDDTILPLIAILFWRQSFMLFSRSVLLQNHDDINRAIHIAEVVFQLGGWGDPSGFVSILKSYRDSKFPSVNTKAEDPSLLSVKFVDTEERFASHMQLQKFIEEVKSILMPWGDVLSNHFREPLPSDWDSEFRATAFADLEGIASSIDEVILSLDIDDSFISLILVLLDTQAVARFYRACFSESGEDLYHAIYVEELALQFCSSPQEHSFVSKKLEMMASRVGLPYPSPLWNPSQTLLSKLHLTVEFILSMELTLQRLDEGSQSPSTNVEHELERGIEVLARIIDREGINVDESELDTMAELLFLRGRVYRQRYHCRGEATASDLDCAISDLETAYALSGTMSLWFPSLPALLFDCLDSRHSRFGDIQELDQIIDIGEDIIRSPVSKGNCEIITLCTCLIFHALMRRASKHNPERSVVDWENILDLFEQNIPMVHKDAYPILMDVASFALYKLTLWGREIDVDKFSKHFNGWCLDSEFVVVPDYYCTFLWGQLKMAAVAEDIEKASTILKHIQALDLVVYYRRLQGVFESHGDLDDTISLLKRHCPAPSPTTNCGPKRPLVLVLAAALFSRYAKTARVQDLQDSNIYFLWSQQDQSQLDQQGFRASLLRNGGGAVARARYLNILKGIPMDERHLIVVRAQPVPKREHLPSFEDVRDRKVERRSPTKQTYRTSIEHRARERAAERDRNDMTIDIGKLGAAEGLNLAVQILKERCESGQAFEPDHFMETINAIKIWITRSLAISSHSDGSGSVEGVSYVLIALDKLRQPESAFAEQLKGTSNEHWLAFYDSAPQIWLLFYGMVHNAEVEAHCLPHVEEMMDSLFCKIEKESWVASSLWESIVDRQKYKGLGSMLTACARKTTKWREGLVVEVNERWLGMIWSQLRQLRAPLDTLATVNPVLASRLRSVSKTLEERWVKFDPSSWDPSSLNPLEISNFCYFEERQRILEDIRMIPGFKSFFQPRSFQDLQKAAWDGGPVVINLSLWDYASFIFLRNGEPDSGSDSPPSISDMELPTPVLSKLHARFRVATQMRSAAPASEPDAFEEGSSRILIRRPKAQTASMEQLLEDLWTQVVEPILDHLLHGQDSRQNSKGKSKAWQIPDRDKRPRLWWCCQGDFSFLPLHAAGIYRGDSPICVSDFFVSSYTPTLGALIDARNRPLPHELKVLAAAQPDAGFKQILKKVGEELKVIGKIVPAQNLTYLNDDGHLDLEGKHTSVENVLAKLPEASVLHLACHGTQDTNNPLRSGFLLEKGKPKRLTIHNLIQHRFPNAFMAILSACHTASNDAEQPEEVMNIASALMFLGFSTILGTKWPMSDLDGPIVAEFVYNALFNQQITPEALKQTSPWIMERLFGEHLAKLKSFTSESDPGYVEVSQQLTEDHIAARTEGSGRTLATFSLAHVVDDLAREMRRKNVPAKRWATFVHIGV